jgi:hypothetical protein
VYEQLWLLEENKKTIQACVLAGDHKARIAAQKVRLDILASMPDEVKDSVNNFEQNNYFYVVNVDGKPHKINLDKLDKLPEANRNSLSRIHFTMPMHAEEAKNIIDS